MTEVYAALKRELFERDGWQADGVWHALCSGGCEAVLTKHTATVDRYPVPGMAGGAYHLDNTRLACADCNSKMGHHGVEGPSVLAGMSDWQRKVFKRALRRGRQPVLTPQDVFGADYEPGLGKPHQKRAMNEFLAIHPELGPVPIETVDAHPRNTVRSATGQQINDACICPVEFREPWHHLRSCSRWQQAGPSRASVSGMFGRHAAMLTPGIPQSRNPLNYTGRHRANM